jgi:FlaA1/EpsC-like NDP-sugar epimerase
MSAKQPPNRRHHVAVNLRRLLGYFLDLAAFSISGFVAFELRFDGKMPWQYLHPMGTALCIWAVAKSITFILIAIRWGHWRFTSANEVVRIVLANSLGSILGGSVIFLLLGLGTIPRSVYILDWLVSCLLTLGARLVVRLAVTARKPDRADGEKTRTLIYGAGAAGLALVRELVNNESLMCKVIGLIDDDPQKADLIFLGKRVLGRGETLGTWVQRRKIKKVLIAIPSATGPQMVRILKLATDARVEYKMVPGLGELLQGADLGKQIREVAVEDLLGRKPVQLDLDLIRERIQGKVVMVTGAAGSIGSEICRQIAKFDPLALIGFDEAETPLFHLDREMAKKFPSMAFHAEIGNITRPDTLRRVMKLYHPTILYHAAAYKHVPLMESHAFAAVETNIFGTWNVARAAAEHGVEDFVMISTDKAVRPTSVMGATKRAAELLIRSLQLVSNTKFVAVRFGNVLGSNGSVVPIFKEQISAGGPVTVTHPEMRRYFMTIPEAAQLVLQAFCLGRGGEIFVLEMGEPVRIAELARNLILLSGLQPERDIEIRFTGLRPGEKMFEELNLQDELLVHTSHPKIRSYLSQENPDARQMEIFLHRLQQIAERQDVAGLLLMLKELIPDYNPGAELLRVALSSRPIQAIPVINAGTHGQTQKAPATKFTPAAIVN